MRFVLPCLLFVGCSLLPFESLEGGDAGVTSEDAGPRTVIDAGFPDGGAVEPMNFFALQRVREAYRGPCVELRREGDDAVREFGFADGGWVDTAAITEWAGGVNVFVVRWFDQSGKDNHAGPVVSENMAGGVAKPGDQPRLLLPDDGGLPSIFFDGHRMDAKSPLNNASGQTLVTCFNTISLSRSQRLLSWAFTDFNTFPDPRGEWDITIDVGDPMPLGVEPRAWHSYVGRWRGNSVGGKQTLRDGEVRGEEDTDAGVIPFASRDVVNIGWFRWVDGLTFGGEVRALLIYRSALGDDALGAAIDSHVCR